MDNNIAVICLGYVGLPLAIEFGKKFDTIGFDINETTTIAISLKIESIYILY